MTNQKTTSAETVPVTLLREELTRRDHEIAAAEEQLRVDAAAIEADEQLHQQAREKAEQKLANDRQVLAQERRNRQHVADALTRLEAES